MREQGGVEGMAREAKRDKTGGKGRPAVPSEGVGEWGAKCHAALAWRGGERHAAGPRQPFAGEGAEGEGATRCRALLGTGRRTPRRLCGRPSKRRRFRIPAKGPRAARRDLLTLHEDYG